MSRASLQSGDAPASKGMLDHPEKVIYFATGSAELALADIQRLGLARNGNSLLIVSPVYGCARLEENPALRRRGVIAYSHGRAVLVWLRLMGFLGLTGGVEIICLNTPQNYRLLKLLAFSLRGRGRFSTGQTQTPAVSILGMMRLSWHNYLIRREQRINQMPVLVVGSGSARTMRLIAARLRQRYPHERLVAWLPARTAKSLETDFDETVVFPQGPASSLRAAVRLLLNGRKFKAAAVPCTNEFYRWMKLPALLAPLREKKIYNEVGDAFDFDQVNNGVRHLQWRFLQTDRKLAWPVAVIGSASGYYLEKIVASLRRSFPGSEIHGWLGPLQAASAGHIFDVVHPLPSSGPSLSTVSRLLAQGRKYRSWIIPCTDEPFGWLKAISLCLPLPKRRLYNEAGDGFPLRSARTAWKHVRWRLRDRFTMQFLSGSSDSTFLHRLVHVPAYAVRLLGNAPTLFRAVRGRDIPSAERLKSITVLVSGNGDSRELLRAAVSDPRGISMTVAEMPPGSDMFDALLQSAQSSRNDYLCILDGGCRVTQEGWLNALLEPFDETVAQVGPELQLEGAREIYQGAIFESDGSIGWNTNSAARFHVREEWLEVAALPSLCVIIRRDALLSVVSGCRRVRSRSNLLSDDLMGELGHLFAINGWTSICNTKVSAFYPLKTGEDQMHFSTVAGQFQQ